MKLGCLETPAPEKHTAWGMQTQLWWDLGKASIRPQWAIMLVNGLWSWTQPCGCHHLLLIFNHIFCRTTKCLGRKLPFNGWVYIYHYIFFYRLPMKIKFMQLCHIMLLQWNMLSVFCPLFLTKLVMMISLQLVGWKRRERKKKATMGEKETKLRSLG